jgi:hypothetical protein
MVMPPKKVVIDNSNIDGRLIQIETQTDYIAKSMDILTSQFTKTEEQRVANLIEYKIQHERVVESAIQASKKADLVETAANREITEVKRSFTTLETEVKDRINETIKIVDDLSDKIDPLLSAHKILVWVTIFFASSIGLLLWGIFTHAVTIVYNK